MAKQKSRNMAVTVDGVRFVLLSSFYNSDDEDQKRHYRAARRLAGKGALEGARVIFDRICVPDTFDVSTVPMPSGRTVTQRDDGREWYRIALTESEYNTLLAGSALPDDAIVTPEQRRENAKQRRAARKAAKVENANTDV